MALDVGAWGRAERRRLRLTRRSLGENQTACAERLRQLGCEGADQAAVSRWETGLTKRPRPNTQDILRRYMEQVADDALILDDERRPPRDTQGDTEEPFAAAVRGLTDEPLLGPLQAAFVEAQLQRLRDGPEMSAADNEARLDLLRVLRLDDR